MRRLAGAETAARPKPTAAAAEFAQGELFEVLEDDQSLPEEVVQHIAKQLVRAVGGFGAC